MTDSVFALWLWWGTLECVVEESDGERWTVEKSDAVMMQLDNGSVQL